MYQIAIQMLLGDRVKYLVLVSVLAFSTLLMVQQSGVFFGVMGWIVANLANTNAPIWVVEPHVQNISETAALRDTDLYRVKSISGVEWAVPLYSSVTRLKTYNGESRPIILQGVDSATLLGIPPHFVKGKLENLREPDTIIIEEVGLKKINQTLEKPLDLGDTLEINDHQVKIAGIVKARADFNGSPFVYTTYERAVAIAPPTRKTLTFILVKPKENVSKQDLAKEISAKTGLLAMTNEQFFWRSIDWQVRNSGIPPSFGITVALGFIIGFAVAGQTFYSFINENLGNFGAFKAMGASESLLRNMLYLQATIVGFIGYGIGLGLSVLFGFFAYYTNLLPFYLSWPVALFIFVLVLLICLFAATLALRKVRSLEASAVFRV